MTIRVSIVGASGYTGLELVKILLKHKQVEIKHLAVRREPLPVYSEIFPELKSLCDIKCSEINADKICEDSDVIFFALPHKVSMTLIPDFVNKGKKIIDLSSDYRIKDYEVYEKAYGHVHGDVENIKKSPGSGIDKSVKFRVKNALVALQQEQRSLAVRIDASIQELDECCDDPNLPSYARMQIWDVVSKLETI